MTAAATALEAEIAQLRTRLERERRIRLEAENLAEQGTRLLYERQQQLEMLHLIAETANGATSIETCLQVALDQWCRYTTWPVGHIYLAAPDDPERLLPAPLWHLDAEEKFTEFRAVTEATPLAMGEGLPGAVLQTGSPVWVVDVMKSSNFPRARTLSRVSVRGAFAFPIRIGAQTVAVAEFFSSQPEEANAAWLHLANQVGSLLGRVFERFRARDQVEQISRQLIKTSRQAGMAEIATGVLHNVGNVLNSVNISASLMQDQLQRSKTFQLTKAVELLQEHHADLGPFLTSDPRGRLLPALLAALAKELAREQTTLATEAQGLRQNIEHIKQIVAMQQSYATVAGTRESLALAELLEDALRMSTTALGRHRIELVREITAVPTIVADRHKALQILVNLIANAKQALESRPEGRRLTLRLRQVGGHVRVEVADNGVGIARENLTKIFGHGFTTKKTGHGFGLHSGANAAKEMGGSLSVQSDGLGCGATFALEMPLPATALEVERDDSIALRNTAAGNAPERP